MNKEEAEKVIVILMDADDACLDCSRELCQEFIENFFEFEKLTEDMFLERFNEPLFQGGIDDRENSTQD
jgi:hypothetical protein